MFNSNRFLIFLNKTYSSLNTLVLQRITLLLLILVNKWEVTSKLDNLPIKYWLEIISSLKTLICPTSCKQINPRILTTNSLPCGPTNKSVFSPSPTITTPWTVSHPTFQMATVMPLTLTTLPLGQTLYKARTSNRIFRDHRFKVSSNCLCKEIISSRSSCKMISLRILFWIWITLISSRMWFFRTKFTSKFSQITTPTNYYSLYPSPCTTLLKITIILLYPLKPCFNSTTISRQPLEASSQITLIME